MLFGKVMQVRLVQPLKNPHPKYVMLLGKVMFVRLVQLRKT